MLKAKDDLLKIHNGLFNKLKTMRAEYLALADQKDSIENEMEELEVDFDEAYEKFTDVVEKISDEIGTSAHD